MMRQSEKIKVLVFPCGSEVGQEACKSLEGIRYIELYGASSIDDHGAFSYKRYYGGLPFVTEPSFLSQFVDLVGQLKIDVVIPAMDSVVEFLAEHSHEIPCRIATSAYETVKICGNKRLTYNVFKNEWFTPTVYNQPEDVDIYPVVLKPAVGYGSRGVKIITSKAALLNELAADNNEQKVICEYLPGKEYTVDCFTDRNGILMYCSARSRNRVRNGISVNSLITETDAPVKEIAQTVNGKLSMRGAWFFQVKRNEAGEYRLLEIASRISGTMCANRGIGVNLPLLAVHDILGEEVSIVKGSWSCEVDSALSERFKLGIKYDSIYLDYDDTLIQGDKVNSSVVSLIYHAINYHKRIILLTRHRGDITTSLVRHRLASELFDDIQQIGEKEKKSEYIPRESPSIYIDDSYTERLEVMLNAKIPVFGIESLDALID